MVLIRPLIFISVPDTIDGYKVVLSRLLLYRNRYQIPLGIEIYISSFQETANKIIPLKRVLDKHNIPFAIYLPVLKENDLKGLMCLDHIKPKYIATQGLILKGDGSRDYIDLCDATADILLSANKSGVDLLIKNSVYPNVGILSSDLLRISEKANCGIMVDTEALIYSVSSIRQLSRSDKHVPLNEEEKECFQRYGFFVRAGKILCPRKSLKDLTLENQLLRINADRYHISGSNTVITDKTMLKLTEIENTPFHRYLLSTVMSMKPMSITVKSCTLRGIHNLDIAFRSMKRLLEIVFDKQIKEVSR